eukprot:TRINITY_DN845_c0_g2_i1.p1 TRINITY_DN845_c0_g2~~TRINITY_DN845_c0_g2_i1.p1  ORF type:complete len:2060 (+),score=156.24 TRINITY_DN845_c0_g2_i1:5530-11709(+)
MQPSSFKFTQQLVELLFAKIKGIPLEKYDEKLIQFMKNFTLNAFYAHSTADQELDGMNPDASQEGDAIERDPAGNVIVPAAGLYCVPIFWEIIQDTLPFNTHMTDKAVQAFLETIKSPRCSNCILPYLFLCMENIKQSKSVFQSLVVAKVLISQFTDKKYSMVYLPYEAIKKLDENFKVVDLLISSLVEYRKLSDLTLGRQDQREKFGKDVIVQGKYTHGQNLAYRMHFLEYILFNSEDLELTPHHLSTLWTEYVTHCRSLVTKKQFLRWLLFDREKWSNTQLKKVFTSEACAFLLNSFCSSFAELSRDFGLLYYKCFERYFVLTNLWQECLERGERLRASKLEEMHGLEELWKLAVQCRHEPTRIKFAQLLVNLYLYLGEALLPKRISLWNGFVSRIMNKIQEAEDKNEDVGIANLINLLLTFFHKLDGTGFHINNLPLTHPISKFTITFTFKPGSHFILIQTVENQSYTYDLPTYFKVGQLRKKIAEKLRIHFSDCLLATRFKILEHEDDEQYAKDQSLAIHPLIISQVEPCLMPSNHPKSALAQSHTDIDTIFRLLSKENTYYAQVCWELLMSLPRNSQIEKDITELRLADADTGWNALLNSTSVHKLLYALQIIGEIVKEPECTLQDGLLGRLAESEDQNKREKWIKEFLEKGGGNHLFYCLLNIPIHSMTQPLSRKCFSLLLKIIIQLFKKEGSYAELAPMYAKQADEIILKILSGIEVFARPTTVRKHTLRSAWCDNSQIEDENLLVEVFDKNEMEIKAKLDEAEAVTNGFRLIKGTFTKDYNYFERVAKFPNFMELMRNGLIFSGNQAFRKNFSIEIISICSECQKFANFVCSPHIVVPTVLLQDLINDAIGCGHECKEFYNFAKQILDRIPKPLLVQLPINHLEVVEKIGLMLAGHISNEHNATDSDETLIGLLDLLTILLKTFPEHRLPVGRGRVGLLNEVLYQCLFNHPTSGNRNLYGVNNFPPKCKSKTSRISAFNLLCILVRDTPENLEEVLGYLTPLHLSGTWRINTFNEWDLSPSFSEKSATGYVGIKNLGCICYMISLLQQLYMIPSFRNAIISAKSGTVTGPATTYETFPKPLPPVQSPPTVSVPETPSTLSPATAPFIVTHAVKDEMLAQLQFLFTALDESVRQYYNPAGFCQAFKDWEGNPINYAEQMDIDEFFNILMDKLENALKETTKVGTIKEHFGGVYLNQIICKDCPHRRDLEEPFLAINLQIKNKKSLHECMESFVEGEMMDGSNAYHCEKCDKKVSAIKRVCIKSLPDHLIFVLKRFSYNYDTMQKVKLNDYCEFPMSLSMDPFMVDYLENPHEASVKTTRSENEYRLVGVVIHRGIADSGHYYSLINDRENPSKWFEFNDNIVSPFDPDKIKEEAFGGEEKWEEAGKRRKSEKISNAYMLFYEKVSKDPLKLPTLPEVPKHIHEAITQDNMRYWQVKLLLSEDYFYFTKYLGLTWSSQIKASYSSYGSRLNYCKNPHEENFYIYFDAKTLSEIALKVFKYLTAAIITTFMRIQNKECMYGCVNLMKYYLGNYGNVAKWFISELCSREVFAELLLGMSPSSVRLVVVGLINVALNKIYEEEKEMVGTDRESLLMNFINFLLSLLPNCRQYKMYGNYYLQLLSRIAMLGPEVRRHLKSVESIRRIAYFLLEVDPSEQKLKSTLTFTLNHSPDLALPTGFKITTLRPNPAPLDYSYLTHCLSVLLRSSNVTKSGAASPLALPPVEPLHDSYILHVLTTKNGLEKILRGCTSKLGSNSLSKALAHLAWESASIKDSIRQALMKLLDEVEYNEVKMCLRPIFIISKYEDTLASVFIENVLADLNSLLQKYQYAYYFTLHTTEYLIKMCRRSRVMLTAFRKSAPNFDWLIEYYNENWHPPRPTPGWSVQYYKSPAANNDILLRLNYPFTAQEASEWKSRTHYMLFSFNKLKEDPIEGNDSPMTEQALDSGADVYEEEFSVGEHIELMLRNETGVNKWIQGIVKKTTGENLFVSYEVAGKEYYIWVDATGDFVAKQGTHVVQLEDEVSSTSKENLSDGGDSNIQRIIVLSHSSFNLFLSQ